MIQYLQQQNDQKKLYKYFRILQINCKKSKINKLQILESISHYEHKLRQKTIKILKGLVQYRRLFDENAQKYYLKKYFDILRNFKSVYKSYRMKKLVQFEFQQNQRIIIVNFLKLKQNCQDQQYRFDCYNRMKYKMNLSIQFRCFNALKQYFYEKQQLYQFIDYVLQQKYFEQLKNGIKQIQEERFREQMILKRRIFNSIKIITFHKKKKNQYLIYKYFNLMVIRMDQTQTSYQKQIHFINIIGCYYSKYKKQLVEGIKDIKNVIKKNKIQFRFQTLLNNRNTNTKTNIFQFLKRSSQIKNKRYQIEQYLDTKTKRIFIKQWFSLLQDKITKQEKHILIEQQQKLKQLRKYFNYLDQNRDLQQKVKNVDYLFQKKIVRKYLFIFRNYTNKKVENKNKKQQLELLIDEKKKRMYFKIIHSKFEYLSRSRQFKYRISQIAFQFMIRNYLNKCKNIKMKSVFQNRNQMRLVNQCFKVLKNLYQTRMNNRKCFNYENYKLKRIFFNKLKDNVKGNRTLKIQELLNRNQMSDNNNSKYNVLGNNDRQSLSEQNNFQNSLFGKSFNLYKSYVKNKQETRSQSRNLSIHQL